MNYYRLIYCIYFGNSANYNLFIKIGWLILLFLQKLCGWIVNNSMVLRLQYLKLGFCLAPIYLICLIICKIKNEIVFISQLFLQIILQFTIASCLFCYYYTKKRNPKNYCNCYGVSMSKFQKKNNFVIVITESVKREEMLS